MLQPVVTKVLHWLKHMTSVVPERGSSAGLQVEGRGRACVAQRVPSPLSHSGTKLPSSKGLCRSLGCLPSHRLCLRGRERGGEGFWKHPAPTVYGLEPGPGPLATRRLGGAPECGPGRMRGSVKQRLASACIHS